MCVIILVSEAPKEAPVRKYLPSSVYLEEKTDEQKKEEVKKFKYHLLVFLLYSHVDLCDVFVFHLVMQTNHIRIQLLSYFDMFWHWMCACVPQLLSAMVAKLGNMDDPLPQDSFEGVDEDEWVSDRKQLRRSFTGKHTQSFLFCFCFLATQKPSGHFKMTQQVFSKQPQLV